MGMTSSLPAERQFVLCTTVSDDGRERDDGGWRRVGTWPVLLKGDYLVELDLDPRRVWRGPCHVAVVASGWVLSSAVKDEAAGGIVIVGIGNGGHEEIVDRWSELAGWGVRLEAGREERLAGKSTEKAL